MTQTILPRGRRRVFGGAKPDLPATYKGPDGFHHAVGGKTGDGTAGEFPWAVRDKHNDIFEFGLCRDGGQQRLGVVKVFFMESGSVKGRAGLSLPERMTALQIQNDGLPGKLRAQALHLEFMQ